MPCYDCKNRMCSEANPVPEINEKRCDCDCHALKYALETNTELQSKLAQAVKVFREIINMTKKIKHSDVTYVAKQVLADLERSK